MEKLPKAYERKYMKMAMLKHEETFKQQVHELHRLYRTQKTLMKNVEKISPEISLDVKRNEICFRQIYGHEDAKNDYRTSSTHNRTKVLDLEQETENEIKDNNSKGGFQMMIINENELQLTLGLSSYNNNTSDSGVTTHPSSSTGSIHDQAGTATTTTTQNSSAYHQNNGSNRPGDQRKMLADYPPWLFQVVSLNMT